MCYVNSKWLKAKWPVTHGETTLLTTQNGLFGRAKQATWEAKTAM